VASPVSDWRHSFMLFFLRILMCSGTLESEDQIMGNYIHEYIAS
jgi:hypothetical protein